METLNLVISIVAVVLAILAYQKAGGVWDLRKRIDRIASSKELRKSIDGLAATARSVREKTGEAIGRLTDALVREEEAKPEEGRPPRAAEDTADKKSSDEEGEKTEQTEISPVTNNTRQVEHDR